MYLMKYAFPNAEDDQTHFCRMRGTMETGHGALCRNPDPQACLDSLLSRPPRLAGTG